MLGLILKLLLRNYGSKAVLTVLLEAICEIGASSVLISHVGRAVRCKSHTPPNDFKGEKNGIGYVVICNEKKDVTI